MNRILLGLTAFVIILASCGKSVKPTVRYSVSNDVNDSVVQDIYIPDNGTYTMNVKVKFLEGYQGQDDKVYLVLNGIPANVKVTPDTFVGVPTFTEPFKFTSTNATQGVYPVSIYAYTAFGVIGTFNFNVHVIPADCAALFFGNLTGSNACTSRLFTHTAAGTSGGTNVLMINNFGGYGSATNVQVVLDCNLDSVHIAQANYGNGVIVQGAGIFNADSMTINYTAINTPTGATETCTLTYKKL